MSESEGTITPILPGNVYAPEPTPSSPDRDPDTPALPGDAKRNPRKKPKNKRPTQPDVPDEESEDSDGVPHVDIRAARIQIEIPDRNEWEIPTVFCGQIALRRSSAPENLAR